MAKRPAALPPHPLAGTYKDRNERRYVVPAAPEFLLFRAAPDGQPLDPHRPTQNDATAFAKALGWKTFIKISP